MVSIPVIVQEPGVVDEVYTKAVVPAEPVT
jgi:hypothetical protein